jgi:hypothetical protein
MDTTIETELPKSFLRVFVFDSRLSAEFKGGVLRFDFNSVQPLVVPECSSHVLRLPNRPESPDKFLLLW